MYFGTEEGVGGQHPSQIEEVWSWHHAIFHKPWQYCVTMQAALQPISSFTPHLQSTVSGIIRGHVWYQGMNYISKDLIVAT